jgi:hypothetical protein
MEAILVPSTDVSSDERRRDTRFEVQLHGELGVDGEIIPVIIGDLSGTGALINMKNPPGEGTIGDLWIVGFGDLEIKVMFSGDGVCGVMFIHPVQHRDRLLKWLMKELAENQASP